MYRKPASEENTYNVHACTTEYNAEEFYCATASTQQTARTACTQKHMCQHLCRWNDPGKMEAIILSHVKLVFLRFGCEACKLSPLPPCGQAARANLNPCRLNIGFFAVLLWSLITGLILSLKQIFCPATILAHSSRGSTQRQIYTVSHMQWSLWYILFGSNSIQSPSFTRMFTIKHPRFNFLQVL